MPGAPPERVFENSRADAPLTNALPNYESTGSAVAQAGGLSNQQAPSWVADITSGPGGPISPDAGTLSLGSSAGQPVLVDSSGRRVDLPKPVSTPEKHAIADETPLQPEANGGFEFDTQNIAVDVVDEMLKRGQATQSASHPEFVTVVDVLGTEIVMWVLEKYRPTETEYRPDGLYGGEVPVQRQLDPAYRLVARYPLVSEDDLKELSAAERERIIRESRSVAKADLHVEGVLSQRAVRAAAATEAALTFVLHVLPFGGAVDELLLKDETDLGEVVFSSVTGVAFVLSCGTSSGFTVGGTTVMKAGTAAKSLVAIDLTIAVVRGSQGGAALYNGHTGDAAGYLGEAFLSLISAGFGARGIIKQGKVGADARTGTWHWNIWDDWDAKVRGQAIHKLLGANLPYGFPVIDKMDWATGVATSIKSINLADKTYQKASKLRALLKDYLNDLANFKGKTFDHVTVTAEQVKQKVLEVAIPPSLRYRPTRAQLEVMDEIKKAAEEMGIQVIFREVNG